jgi:hypothetical protein
MAAQDDSLLSPITVGLQLQTVPSEIQQLFWKSESLLTFDPRPRGVLTNTDARRSEHLGKTSLPLQDSGRSAKLLRRDCHGGDRGPGSGVDIMPL